MVKHKAEVIEREYIQRRLAEVFDSMKKVNANIPSVIPECIVDAILHMTAFEVVACRICQSAQWN